MSLEEDIHAIRQDIERLVHNFTGDKRPGEGNHRDRQRNPHLQRTPTERLCIRSTNAPRVWGPFDTEDEAWNWLYKRLEKIYPGAPSNQKANFEEDGEFTLEIFWQL